MSENHMHKGIAYAIGACVVWGLIFIVPYFMPEYSPIEVVIGRYMFYGSLSTFLFFRSRWRGAGKYPGSIWFKAFYFCLIATIGYYTFLVLAVRYSSPAICALILGISPIAIAFYGNWRQKETTFKSLIGPSFLILVGLIIINIPEFKETASQTSYALGLMFSFAALVAWSWYVVANSRFLNKHTHVRSSDWATLIGVSSFCWAFILIITLAPFFETPLEMTKYFAPKFLIGSATLGLLCSWVGAYLWNKASLYLPVSLAGQLTIFETIFGVLYFYLFTWDLPSWIEVVGTFVLLGAIVYGIRKFAKRKAFTDQIKPH